MSPRLPDDCIQVLTNGWWERTSPVVGPPVLRRGQLIKAFIPIVGALPYQLVPEGRSADPTDHTVARYRVLPLTASGLPPGPALPVAGLPSRPGEPYALFRAKRRPALVLSTSGSEIDASLKKGFPAWQTTPTVLVAPFFGVEADGGRAGWPPQFVTRIRRCEYPQYVWDYLPGATGKESILRLDQMQPIGKHAASHDDTGFSLTAEGLSILDEWTTWLITGTLGDGALAAAREALSDFPS